MMTRRQALKTTLLSSAACTIMSADDLASAQPAQPPGSSPAGPFTLPPLPYSFDALEPHIDARTMEIHHDKHHAAYVTNLNKAIEGNEAANLSLEELMKSISKYPAAVRNNGGGNFNHSMFWLLMKPGGGGSPKGNVE